MLLLLSAEQLAVELKVGIAEIVAQCACSPSDHAFSHIVFNLLLGECGHQLLCHVHHLGLCENHLLGCGQSHQVEILAPVDGREALLHLLDGEDVVLLRVVACFHLAHLGLCKLIFDVIDCLGSSSGIALLVSCQHIHFHQIVDIGFLYLLAVGIGVEVVVAVGHAACSGLNVEHVHVAVHQVGFHADAEERVCQVQMLVGNKRCEVALLEPLHHGKVGKQRGVAFLIQAHAVHCQIVEVGDFLPHGAAGMLFLCQVVEQLFELLAIVLGQVVEHAIACILGFQGIGFHPATAGILIEVVAGVHTQVHVGTVQAMRLSRSRSNSHDCNCCH